MKIIFIGAVWCSSCLIMKSRLQSLLKEYPEIDVISYDYDDEPDKISRYDIGTKLPVIVFEDRGTEVLRIVGEKNKNEINTLLRDLYK